MTDSFVQLSQIQLQKIHAWYPLEQGRVCLVRWQKICASCLPCYQEHSFWHLQWPLSNVGQYHNPQELQIQSDKQALIN